jgi:hypothetical protein
LLTIEPVTDGIIAPTGSDIVDGDLGFRSSCFVTTSGALTCAATPGVPAGTLGTRVR